MSNETNWFSWKSVPNSNTYHVLPDPGIIQGAGPRKSSGKPSRTGLQLSAWSLEIWAAVLSICALAALIAVLWYANGRIVHSWNGITLNTVVSGLATISKLCATFVVGSAIAQAKWCLFRKGPQSLQDFEAIDLASRGASGCFTLLFRARNFSLIGAYAIILAMIFDPFAQQLVHSENVVVYSSSQAAKIPRATRYSAGNRIVISGTTYGAGPAKVAAADGLMQAAIASALVQSQNETVQQLQYNCPSGNCTWPVFESLAVCSTCNDLQSYLTQSGEDQPLFMYVALSNPGSAYYDPPISVPTLPNGLTIDDTVQMTTWGTSDPAKTVSMQNIDTLIWSMTILKEKPSSIKRSSPQYEAIECSLRYCVQRYKSDLVDNNITETTSIMESAVRDPDSWTVVGDFWYDPEGYKNTTQAQKTSLDFYSTTAGLTRTDLTLGQHYNISQAAIDGIGSHMYDNFADLDMNYTGINGGYIDGTDQESAQYRPSANRQIWLSEDLDGMFDTIAVSMSNALRARSDNRETKTGQQGISVVKFRIVWPWIALPMIVILACLTQLVIVIRASRTVPLWKESTLAVLSRGKALDNVLARASTAREMREEASKTKVNLFDDGTELRSLKSRNSNYSLNRQHNVT